MSAIAVNLQAVLSRIAAAATACGRQPEEIALIAVAKTFPAEDLIEILRAGHRRVGESYLQEASSKQMRVAQLAPDLKAEWHFIGPIQSNKTRRIAEDFDWVHSVDREKIAQRLSAQRPAHLPPLQVCIEVNLSGEVAKSGVTPDQLPGLAAVVAHLPRLALRGLMTIPDPAQPRSVQRATFARLRQLALDLRSQGLDCPHLSMGMSDDLEDAIAEGATLVRVGSAIFGNRPQKRGLPATLAPST